MSLPNGMPYDTCACACAYTLLVRRVRRSPVTPKANQKLLSQSPDIGADTDASCAEGDTSMGADESVDADEVCLLPTWKLSCSLTILLLSADHVDASRRPTCTSLVFAGDHLVVSCDHFPASTRPSWCGVTFPSSSPGAPPPRGRHTHRQARPRSHGQVARWHIRPFVRRHG